VSYRWEIGTEFNHRLYLFPGDNHNLAPMEFHTGKEHIITTACAKKYYFSAAARHGLPHDDCFWIGPHQYGAARII